MKTYSKFFLLMFSFCLLVSFCHLAQAGDDRSMADDKGRPQFVIGCDLGVLLDADIKDIKAATELWMGQVAEVYGLTADIVIYSDSASMLKDFKDGRVDMANTTTLDYLRIAEELETDLAYSAIFANEKPTRKYLLIVRSDAGFTEVKDLARKKLAVKKTDDASLLFLNTHLLRNKQPEAAGFFSSIIEKRKSSQAVLSVFFRQADACIANEEAFTIMSELNPQIGKQLKVIVSSPEIISTLSFFRKDYSEKIKTIILNNSKNLINTVGGRQLLTLFKVADIYLLTDSDLDSFRLLVKEYRQLKEHVRVRKQKRDN